MQKAPLWRISSTELTKNPTICIMSIVKNGRFSSLALQERLRQCRQVRSRREKAARRGISHSKTHADHRSWTQFQENRWRKPRKNATKTVAFTASSQNGRKDDHSQPWRASRSSQPFLPKHLKRQNSRENWSITQDQHARKVPPSSNLRHLRLQHHQRTGKHASRKINAARTNPGLPA